ncbi:hypothetical protein ON010_g4942 [Phytophthora cinnamomi]|nr:hypothetical protein ON010_g4942 [Phytophthora cinnamomi]
MVTGNGALPSRLRLLRDRGRAAVPALVAGPGDRRARRPDECSGPSYRPHALPTVLWDVDFWLQVPGLRQLRT